MEWGLFLLSRPLVLRRMGRVIFGSPSYLRVAANISISPFFLNQSLATKGVEPGEWREVFTRVSNVCFCNLYTSTLPTLRSSIGGAGRFFSLSPLES